MSAPTTDASPRPTTLGELRASGWVSLPVREEIRANALRRVAADEPVVAGVLGYEQTVIPQLEHALLAGHDVIFLGERGQAKSRMIRSLAELLDEWTPVVAGSELHDDPYAPISSHAKALVHEHGESTPIEWVHRSRRYAEKLATPDTAIADLIGEVDPIKVAEGRYLSDEYTIHYGLVPRMNRGIFAINELPDLAERIQVGLLDVLEERDVQIRGYALRLPLDVLLVASANPDDYTSRGRIISPLKDRFGAQIRTHYPDDVATEVAIVRAEATRLDVEGVEVVMPEYMADIVGRLTHLARSSPRVNQRSGVSVRATTANYETLGAAALRRAVRLGESVAVPRPSDLDALHASMLGKIEVESFEDGEDAEILDQLLNAAILQTYRDYLDIAALAEVVAAFESGAVAEVGPAAPSPGYEAVLEAVPDLRLAVAALVGEAPTPPLVASAVEFVLEGLYLSRRLNKDVVENSLQYRAR